MLALLVTLIKYFEDNCKGRINSMFDIEVVCEVIIAAPVDISIE
jgi:hypothetical protein